MRIDPKLTESTGHIIAGVVLLRTTEDQLGIVVLHQVTNLAALMGGFGIKEGGSIRHS